MSVVFVDLVGHTARSDTADPEDCRGRWRRTTHAPGTSLSVRGTVEQFIGDAVMAVFGAPVHTRTTGARRAGRAGRARRAGRRRARDSRRGQHGRSARLARRECGRRGGARRRRRRRHRLADAVGCAGQRCARRCGHASRNRRDRVPGRRRRRGQREVGARARLGGGRPRARLGVDVYQHGNAELIGRELEVRLLYDAFERGRSARCSS